MPEVLNPGDRVECDDDYFIEDKQCPFKPNQIHLPVAEKQYTIRNVVWTQYGMGIRLVELVNREYYFGDIKGYREPILDITRFHLVQTKVDYEDL